MGSPLFNNFLFQNVNLVELHENLGDGGDEIRIVYPEEAFETA
jgi:hypothetical protein